MAETFWSCNNIDLWGKKRKLFRDVKLTPPCKRANEEVCHSFTRSVCVYHENFHHFSSLLIIFSLCFCLYCFSAHPTHTAESSHPPRKMMKINLINFYCLHSTRLAIFSLIRESLAQCVHTVYNCGSNLLLISLFFFDQIWWARESASSGRIVRTMCRMPFKVL